MAPPIMGLPPESPAEERRWNFEFGAKLEAFLLLDFQLCIAWLSFQGLVAAYSLLRNYLMEVQWSISHGQVCNREKDLAISLPTLQNSNWYSKSMQGSWL
jgi:hypothetical protein